MPQCQDGVLYTNTATIYASGDTDTTNNTASATGVCSDRPGDNTGP